MPIVAGLNGFWKGFIDGVSIVFENSSYIHDAKRDKAGLESLSCLG